MKRSIIGLCLFALLVIAGTCGEFIYANNLAENIDRQIENFNGEESVEKLHEIFKERSIINRFFLRENIIERFEVYFTELEVSIKYKDNARTEEILNKINLYTKDLHCGRIF